MTADVQPDAKSVRLPAIAEPRGIYQGRYDDKSPAIRGAGKLTDMGDTAYACLNYPPRAPSPDVIRRFRATFRPASGKERVFYGRALDPQREWAKLMRHGLTSHVGARAAEVLNPKPKTNFQQRHLDHKEDIYLSHQKAPLGQQSLNGPQLPNNIDVNEHRFGVVTVRDMVKCADGYVYLEGSAGELINPPKSAQQVYDEGEVGRNLYRLTHKDFWVGEQKQRNYKHDSYGRFDTFGAPTPHDNEGNPTYKSLKWVTELLSQKAAPIVSRRVDEFRERTQPQLGKVHDPIKDTLNVPPDHTYGILVKADKYGAGDLLHNRDRREYLRGLERDRGIIAAIRAQLKKANYHNFHDLVAAFRFYDKTKSGQISIADLQEVLLKFNLPAEPEIVIQLMYYCDKSNTGFIDYTEFSNFLNWKENMPSGLASVEQPSNIPVDPVEIKEPPPPFEPERLLNQIDRAIGDHRTSSSMINAVVGGIPTHDYRTYGVPTIRSDIPAPRIRRICDTTNYGDGSDAFGLLSPSIYSTYGVYDRDFLSVRPREQIREFFYNVGVEMDSDTFQKIYAEAASRHPGCEVSIESFRMVMDEMQGIEIMKSANKLL